MGLIQSSEQCYKKNSGFFEEKFPRWPPASAPVQCSSLSFWLPSLQIFDLSSQAPKFYNPISCNKFQNISPTVLVLWALVYYSILFRMINQVTGIKWYVKYFLNVIITTKTLKNLKNYRLLSKFIEYQLLISLYWNEGGDNNHLSKGKSIPRNL